MFRAKGVWHRCRQGDFLGLLPGRQTFVMCLFLTSRSPVFRVKGLWRRCRQGDFLGLLPGRETFVIDKSGKVLLAFNNQARSITALPALQARLTAGVAGSLPHQLVL